MRGFNLLTRMRSKRGGGAAGVLADEGCARRHAEERRARHLRERAGQRPALRLLRHLARRILFRQFSGNHRHQSIQRASAPGKNFSFLLHF